MRSSAEPEHLALHLYERFEAAVVANLPCETWTLNGVEIVEACRRPA